MPVLGEIDDFVPGDSPGAARLNTVVTPINRTLREFNERARPDEYVASVVPCVVEISSAGTGHRSYIGGILNGQLVGDDTTDFTLTSVFKTAGNGTPCVVYNYGELDSATHALAAGTRVSGVVLGLATNNRPLVLVNENPANSATLITVGSNTEGSETANTATWTRSTDNAPLDLWVTCRVVYNDAGDEKLYEFRRKLSFDSRGWLSAVSGETRIEVDAPVACS